jgi:hypothetical protein
MRQYKPGDNIVKRAGGRRLSDAAKIAEALIADAANMHGVVAGNIESVKPWPHSLNQPAWQFEATVVSYAENERGRLAR